MEVKNIATAMNVVEAYKFSVDYKIICILIMFGVCSFLCWVERAKIKHQKKSKKAVIFRKLFLLLVILLTLYAGYFAENSVKPKKTITWQWKEAYYEYGYLACSIEMIGNSVNYIEIPDGYSSEQLTDIVSSDVLSETGEKPDIILILNETFFDLGQITDLETDLPYMNNIYSKINNLITGYAVVPLIGGGTNCSEYELLSSNSLRLMPGITPFNVLDMHGANTIVSHLNSLGYVTIGAHSEDEINYSRGIAYRQMGFDKVYFDEDFIDKEYYCERLFETDESLYRNLIRWYETEDEDTPKFIYLLTIQNHALYDSNPEEADIVHVLNDYGEYNSIINEYLSCIYYSDQAFAELVEYFENVERPVVVCMVGDHSPAFASDIIDAKFSDDEANFLLRSTPIVIWSNYDLDCERDLGAISINFLVPALFEMIGIQPSPYYQYMQSLKEQVPVLTSYGVYYDYDRNIYSYYDMSEYSALVMNYFYLEYNNLSKDRQEGLFSVE